MRSQRIDEELLVNYLLGNLTEQEQALVEDRAFADPRYLSAVEAAEADLIDAYVRGELSQADRQAFETRFLNSAQRRSKVEFAKALARVAAETPLPVSASPSLLALIRAWNPAVRFAAGFAAVVIIAGGSWVVVDSVSAHSRISALETREQGLKRQLGQERDRAGRLAAQLQRRPPQETTRTPAVASLILMSGLARGETRVQQLALDPRMQLVHIEIQVEPRDEYPQFRIELRTRGREILSLSDLVRRRAGAGYAVVLDVPSSALAAGEYELALQGMAADAQQAHEIGYYYFRVQKQ
jgi:hypothetical protein